MGKEGFLPSVIEVADLNLDKQFWVHGSIGSGSLEVLPETGV